MNNQLNNISDYFPLLSEKEKNNNLFKITKSNVSNNQLLLNKNKSEIEINQSDGLNTQFLNKKTKMDNISDIKRKPKLEEKEVKSIPWTEEDDKLLLMRAQQNNEKNWKKIASSFKGRTSIQCSSRYHRIKPGLAKGHFTREEDLKLISLYNRFGKKWNLIAKEMKNRTGKQVRDRFLNSLAPGVNKNRFTLEEDEKILKYYKIYGKSWSSIAKYINGRTGDMIKNRFYSHLSKNPHKTKYIKNDLNEEEKVQKEEHNIEKKIDEQFGNENCNKDNMFCDLNKYNIQNNYMFKKYNNIVSNNNIFNNNNLFMKNYFENQNYFISNLLISNYLLTKENNNTNRNNFININLNFQNQKGFESYNNNNEINNNINLKYNNFETINNNRNINYNIDYNNKSIKNVPYTINPYFTYNENINEEQKFLICKTFSSSL